MIFNSAHSVNTTESFSAPSKILPTWYLCKKSNALPVFQSPALWHSVTMIASTQIKTTVAKNTTTSRIFLTDDAMTVVKRGDIIGLNTGTNDATEWRVVTAVNKVYGYITINALATEPDHGDALQFRAYGSADTQVIADRAGGTGVVTTAGWTSSEGTWYVNNRNNFAIGDYVLVKLGGGGAFATWELATLTGVGTLINAAEMTTSAGNKNITSTNNNLGILVHSGSSTTVYHVNLTVGSARTPAQIAAEINAQAGHGLTATVSGTRIAIKLDSTGEGDYMQVQKCIVECSYRIGIDQYNSAIR